MATGLSKTRWNGSHAIIDTVNTNSCSDDIKLSFRGKKNCIDVLRGAKANLEVFWRSKNADGFSNRLVYGDNLQIILRLLGLPQIAGKVKLIYIDPPYATNSVFQAKGQKDAYQDLLHGSEYLVFMHERLLAMKELLSDDGSIYIHLDENMAFEVKLVMDEVFGKSNFRNWITRRKCSTKNTTKKRYGDISDYILYYTKTSKFIWNRPYDEWTEDKILKEYPCIEPETGRRYKKVPIHAPGVRNGETGKPWRGVMPPTGKHWQYTPSKLEQMDLQGEIYWSATNNPRRKVYYDGEKGIPKQDIWLEYRDSINQNMRLTGYPTEKNLNMLETIVRASSNQGDIVMDCFCGSGSTLQAAYQNNRQWIGIDNSIEAICATLRRFHMGVNVMGDYVNPSEVEIENRKLLDSDSFTPTLFEKCPIVLEIQKEYLDTAKNLWS